MNNQMKSRVATLDDAHELAHLNTVFNGVQLEPKQLSSRLANPHCAETPIVAEVGNLIVGFASLCLVPRVFYDTPQLSYLSKKLTVVGVLGVRWLPTQSAWHAKVVRQNCLF